MIKAATERLLLTGRSGFVGEVFSRVLNRSARGQRWSIAEVPADFDVRDAAAMKRLLDAARPDAVVHLAAQSAVPESIRDPEATLQINLMGTLHLLQGLDSMGFRGRLLYVGTGDVYGLVPESELPVA